jgi:RNA polymerase sigma-70 factor (ECF subfamily)
MANRPGSAAIPFPGRLTRDETPGSPISELESEIVGLFDQTRGRLLRYALSFGLSIADAEEVVQDVFLALYQHLSRGKSRDSLCGWLFRVTRNMSLKRRAAISRRPGDCAVTPDGESESLWVADPRPNPEDQIAFRQRQDRLRSVVCSLQEIDRECLYLRSEGLRYREISDVLGISVGGVANSLARSLARLSAVDERLK